MYKLGLAWCTYYLIECQLGVAMPPVQEETETNSKVVLEADTFAMLKRHLDRYLNRKGIEGYRSSAW